MKDSILELKKNYNSFELMKPSFSIGARDDFQTLSQGKTFLETIYTDEKIPFSSATRKGRNI